jgi:hypothetical protein
LKFLPLIGAILGIALLIAVYIGQGNNWYGYGSSPTPAPEQANQQGQPVPAKAFDPYSNFNAPPSK